VSQDAPPPTSWYNRIELPRKASGDFAAASKQFCDVQSNQPEGKDPGNYDFGS